ncbi:Probable serine/threonine-protein kinase pknH [Nocardia farcinica]|uniref:non-specific serine/threonine protein kinase n=1 Tax=Nocardia farcinica TaxID=37329 RepID=A0A449H1T4_NOCFR|nr:Probable serine/threonine-protein kinase pknH [Nocardia farcinica]
MDGPGRRVGTRFGPYELRSLLGKGGMGEVYEAFDTSRHRLVAVKLLADELAKDPVYQERFRRESQAAARLAEPHVIPIHDWGVLDGVLFIDMRLVAGTDLRTMLHHTGPLEPERAVRLVEQVAAALDAAHADGLIHRDVKPANILVTDADFAYLADFGIAHTEGDSAITQVGMAVGSYIYMAPERFDSGTVTGRADIYSLACVLHECLTGAAPFPSASMNVLVKAHLSEPPPRASALRPGLPASIDAVIARGMAKNPADRFASALEMTRAARAALGMRDTAAPPRPGGPGGVAPAAPVPPAPATGGVPVTTGTGPTFVVRAPDPSRFGAKSEPTVAASVLPPESTGEMSVPAVIHPTAPTVVRPSEFEFSPLPTQEQAIVPPASGAIPQVRPFPDEHLYPESQRYGSESVSAPMPAVPPVAPSPVAPAPAAAAPRVAPPTVSTSAASPGPGGPVVAHDDPPAPAAQPYSDEHPSGTYPVTGRAPADEPVGYVGARAYSDTDRPAFTAPETTRYPVPPVPEVRQPAPETARYDDPAAPATRALHQPYPPHAFGPAAPHGAGHAEPHPDPHAAYGPGDPHGVQAYSAIPDDRDRYGHPDPYGGQPGHHPDPYAGAEYAAPGEPYADPGRDRHAQPGYGDPHAYAAPGPERGRAMALPLLAALAVVLVLVAGGLVAWRMFGGGDTDTTASEGTVPVATTAARPTGAAPPPATSARPTTTTTTRVQLPAGAKTCGSTSSAPNGNAAAGNSVTSCPFAEEVRRAYAAEATPGTRAPQTITAVSPVTGRSYTMTCVPDDGLVTCTGGENAIVYVY